jgi:hypothetical protein
MVSIQSGILFGDVPGVSWPVWFACACIYAIAINMGINPLNIGRLFQEEGLTQEESASSGEATISSAERQLFEYFKSIIYKSNNVVDIETTEEQSLYHTVTLSCR